VLASLNYPNIAAIGCRFHFREIFTLKYVRIER
jgi:hypothetical protein